MQPSTEQKQGATLDGASASATVAILNRFRPESQPAERPAQQRASTRSRSRSRTAFPKMLSMLDRLIRNFERDHDDVFYIDHETHDIRTAFSGDFEIDGTIKARTGVIFTGVIRSPESLVKSVGTIIIDADADVSINIECETLIVLGKHSGSASVTGTLINIGTMKGDYAYGALESFGLIEGSVEQITD